MKKQLTTILLLFLALLSAGAQTWDEVKSGKDYIYGEATGATVEEADRQALVDLASKIALQISSDFTVVDEDVSKNGNFDSKTFVKNCVNSYTQTSLTNTEKWVVGKEPNFTVRRWIKRSEVDKIFADRIAKAKEMLQIASDAAEQERADMALQYYYWAYSLIRSTQHPDRVEWNGHKVTVWVPLQIDAILSNISAVCERREGNNVDLKFAYKGQPVKNLDFTYSDGRTECSGSAKDGWGMLEMAPGYESDFYNISVEYEYKGNARGDAEMENVLNVLTKRVFPNAELKILTKKTADKVVAPVEIKPVVQGNDLTATQVVASDEQYGAVYDKILNSIKTPNYSSAKTCFTVNGLDVYKRLICMGSGRIIEESAPVFFKGSGGCVVVRGLRMSFTFNIGHRKKTFVEDVAFTFNKEGKCDNISFGLGAEVTNNIMVKPTGWKEEARELILEFLENYKTAFCLKRIDFLKNIFHDDTPIIVGSEVKVATINPMNERQVTSTGRKIIKYNRYTKYEYISKLRRAFNANEFINIRFTECDVQWQEAAEGEFFSIQIAQDYCSSSYADQGYLFLMFDATNHDAPQIKICTWQPEKDPEFGIYGPGHFYNY